MFALTLAVQTVRVLAIWLSGKAVGVDLSPRPYYVMGPLLFLVLLLPISVNGIAVRESFFVSFLGNLGVDADKAFATGFLFFVVTLALSLPGALLLGWQSLRGFTPPARRRTMADVSVVVVTYNALPWVERALESVRGHETIVVDHGSTDGTARARPRAVPRRAPDRAGEQGPRRRLERGHAHRLRRLLPAPELGRLGARRRRRAARALRGRASGGRGRRARAPLNPDGSLQRSVRGFPTLWRLATEYLFLRKLAPRTRALNAFYGAASPTTRCARPSS